MRFIEHLIEPERLLLSWQAQESTMRSRYIIGELVRKADDFILNYFKDSADYVEATQHGFNGYPAFMRSESSSYDNQVLEAFTRRLPPRNRSDFYRYLELRGINPDADISDFALLGYAGAKLPDDGFELVHPFENVATPFEFITEIAGFRHNSVLSPDNINLGDTVNFVPEPNNEHDSHAIRVDLNGNKLGYIDRGRLSLLQSYIDCGCDISATINRKNGTAERPLIYIYITIQPCSS